MLERLSIIVALAALFTGVTGCAAPAGNTSEFPTRLVLADEDSSRSFHPATGYGQTGVSPVYDGLLRPVPAGQGAMPTFAPALAAQLPTPNQDASEWTVQLKPDVQFSDSSALDAADVKASYELAKDPRRGSEVASFFDAIASISTPDPHTVVFRLAYPVAEFAPYLTYAIAPAELLTQSVSDSELTQHPVGTGAFTFVSRRGSDVTLRANENYWAGPAPIKELVITTATDDTARGQRVVAGEIDGAIIPQAVAQQFAGKRGVRVDVAKGADWRAISLPATGQLADAHVRQALNLAIDRAAIVRGPLAGFGQPAVTPVTAAYGPAHNSNAVFGGSVAEHMAAAGYQKDNEGTWANASGAVGFDLFYLSSDTVRRDIAVEVATQLRAAGFAVQAKPGTWDDITPRMAEAAVVLGGGESPYDVALAAYEHLHTRTADSSPYANPGNYGSPEQDQLVEQARRETNPERRAELWRQAQEGYVANPSLVMLATVDHTYLSRPTGWQMPELMMEPHIHGATWGPWWRLAEWRR